MQLGMIGLGRMGGNMARRLRRAGFDVVGYNQDEAATAQLAAECDLVPASSTDDLVTRLTAPRVVWLMLPAGEVTESYVVQLADRLSPGDVLVDGANSWFKDSMRRGELLAERHIGFVDAGVSGGVWGLANGYALMVGGEAAAVERVTPVLKALAPSPTDGWLHCGPAGSGHYVKMIHNGIEYGMMQAYAEGFALMESRDDFDLDLAAVAEMWRHGSVVRSWLLDLIGEALADGPALDRIDPYVADSGEGRWTTIEAVEQGVPAPVMGAALMMRFASQGGDDFGAKLLAMMRQGFGGHAVRKDGDDA